MPLLQRAAEDDVVDFAPVDAGALDRGLTLALDGIQDPGNVGTLLRTAEAVGVGGGRAGRRPVAGAGRLPQ